MRLLPYLLLLLALCPSQLTIVAAAQATDTYQVVHAYPHDEQAFTQGLIWLPE